MKRKFKRGLSLLLMCALVLTLLPTTALAAPSGGQGSSVTIKVGDTKTINGSPYYWSNTWTSSNPGVATVKENGSSATVTGVSEGTATITHKGKASSEMWTVTVESGSYKVYVYARFYDENGNALTAEQLGRLGYQGLTLNKDGWFTYGVIENATTVKPAANQTADQAVRDAVIAQLGRVKRYQNNGQTVNESIQLGSENDDIEYELKTAAGATDYPVTETAWHLDCKISVSTLSKYTVHYYKADTTEPVSHSKTNQAASIGAKVTENAVEVTGYTLSNGTSSPATITIDKDETKNVIIFYYTPNSATIKYVAGEGGSVSPESETVNVVDGVPVGSTATANEGYYFAGWFTDESGTEPVNSGKVGGNNKLTPDRPTQDVTYYAKFEKKGEITVSVGDKTVTYNGTTQTGSSEITASGLPDGYTYTVVGYTPASGQDAKADDCYTGSFSDDKSITIKDASGNDVTDQYTVSTWTPGKLIIKPKSVTVTVNNDSKTYGDDDPDFTGTVTGTVEGETLDVSYARAEGDKDKENVGDEIAITASYTANDNYEVTVTDGKLTIVPADSNAVSVTDYSGTYDGAPHSVTARATKEGSTVYYSTGEGESENWSTTKPAFTDAGTYTVYVKAINNNYAETQVVSATVTITARPITITAGSASKVYDGTSLTKDSWTITNGTLVDGHVVSATVTGSQTNVGSSENKAGGAKITGASGNDVTKNYSITYVNGTLTVTGGTHPYVPPVGPSEPAVPSKPELNLEDHVAYIIGDSNGMVRPLANITRAEVATIFFRLMTDESRTEYWCTTNDFTDVADTDWYNNAVSTLANAGILLGRPDGAFGPSEFITRAEFAAIAARFSDVKYEGGYTFPDVPETHWAYNDIGLAYQLGWVLGQPDGNFKPNRNITRAEAITLINRVLERDVEEEHLLSNMIKWPDNLPSAWYYEAIQEATNSHAYTRTDVRVPSQNFNYEDWHEIIENPDWVALERDWLEASKH